MADEWVVRRVGDLVSQRRERITLTPGEKYRTMGVRWYGKGAYLRGVETTETVKARHLWRARAGDFIFNRIDTQKGAFDVVPEDLDGALVTNEFPVYTAGPEVETRFLLLHFQRPDVLTAIGAARGGSEGRARWKESDFEASTLAVPPMPVQQRIVDVMAGVDAHLDSLLAEREALETVLRVLRADLATTSTVVPLSSLSEPDGIQIGPFGSQLHAHEYADIGTPVVMPRDIVRGQIDPSNISRVPESVATRLNRHVLKPGDIVFPRRGDLSKRALVTPSQEGWICGTGCIRFRPAPGVDGQHVFESISGSSASEWLIEHAVGTTMLNLNTQILSNLPVPDPSSGDKRVAAACTAAAAAVEGLRGECAALEGLRTELLGALLTGRAAIPSSYDALRFQVA